MTGAASAPARSRYDEPAAQEEKRATRGEKFPDDEPLFARATDEVATAPASQRTEKDEASEVESDDWDREMKRQHERNVAAVFGTSRRTLREEAPAVSLTRRQHERIVEEEIEEEETDLAHYSEEIDDDAEFAEMEEEVHAAGELQEERAVEISASAQTASVEEVEGTEDGGGCERIFSRHFYGV